MALLEFAPERVPLIKFTLHGVQFVLVFVLWCLEIAVFRGTDAKLNGNNAWPFGLCFLTLPAWIYLIMAPRFPRTRKLAEPRAMAVVDAIFAILWLSAMASQAAYNSQNSCGEVCNLSKPIVGLAFFITFFFVLSTLVSIYTVKYWQWNNGRLPGYPDSDNKKIRVNDNDPDKNAFSTEMHDEEAYGVLHHNEPDAHEDDDHAGSSYGGGYSSLGSRYRPDDSALGGAYSGVGSSYNEYDSEYRSQMPSGGDAAYRPTTAADARRDDGQARFPPANY